MQAESPITVACIQMEPKIGEKKANVAHKAGLRCAAEALFHKLGRALRQ
jgi:uncharacterized small protein (DUF1192 family)